MNPSGEVDFNDLVFERVLGVNDLVDIRFLTAGAAQSSAVARVRLRRGFGTGFLISHNVLMTNWHVLPTLEAAATASVEFGFREVDSGGQLSQPTAYRLDPSQLFFSDREHDVAVVAVGQRTSGSVRIADLATIRLTAGANTVIRGDRVNIIQHPGGEPKQVALRDNTVIDFIDDTFVHYRADTQPGSSGSPVFNDEWELVALHHSGVPKRIRGQIQALGGGRWDPSMGDHRIHWIANEGILASALRELLGNQSFRGSARELIDAALSTPHLPANPSPSTPIETVFEHPLPPISQQGGEVATAVVHVPLKVTVAIGGVQQGTTRPFDASSPVITDGATALADALVENFSIDRDYSNRRGYASDFLAADLPRPILSKGQRAIAARNRTAGAQDDPFELPYHNFSVVMNGARRLCFYSAVNIDGNRLIRIPRDDAGGATRWITDDRIGDHEQADNRFYRGSRNRLDRGHVVRRLDPAWGNTRKESARGILDTFHYTNSTPQYDTFNRSGNNRRREEDRLWLALEEFILDNAKAEGLRISVFAGPVFGADDPEFLGNGLAIPQEYWKIVAWADRGGALKSASFLLSQARFLDRDRDIEADFRDRELFQTSISTIANRTGLDFGPLTEVDPSELSQETFVRDHGVLIKDLNEIRLN